MDVGPHAFGEIALGKEESDGDALKGHSEASEGDERGADAIAQADHEHPVDNEADAVWDGGVRKRARRARRNG